MQSEVTICRSCGFEVDAGLLGGVCASCLLDEVLAGGGEQRGAGAFTGHELLGEIARGGMGVVYRARQLEPERIVALKTLRGASLDSAEDVARFRHEADVMVSLDHPAILPVYHFGEADGIPFFTMKLADGGTLAGRIASFAGKWRETAALMVSLCDAVRHAHERGVLHRDLKPGNVLFDSAGQAFVSDFGIAKLASSPNAGLTMTLSVLGTPHYLAPEVAIGNAKAASVASDVWSLGVILFELLTGERPFKGESVTMVLRALDAGDAPQPRTLREDVPRDLEVITMKALSRDPARRYAGAGALAEDLRAWLEGRPIQARAVPAAERAWMWARRNPLPASLAALCVLALVAAVAALVWGFVRVREENTRVIASRAETREQLREALLLQARAGRLAGEMGWRASGLRALREAGRVHPGDDLRDEVIAHLAGYDLGAGPEVPTSLVDGGSLFFSPDFDEALGRLRGAEGADGLIDINSRTLRARLPPLAEGLTNGAALDGAGRWIARRSGKGGMSILSRPDFTERFHLPAGSVPSVQRPFTFSRDGSRLVLEGTSELKVLRAGDWKEEASFPRKITEDKLSVCVEPGLDLLCELGADGLEITDWKTGGKMARIKTAGRPVKAAWMGDRLLVSLDKGHFQYFDFRRGTSSSLPAHDSVGNFLLMPRDRSLLLASSVDGVTLLCHPGGGQRLCQARGQPVDMMSADGSRFRAGLLLNRLGVIEHSPCLKLLPEHVLNIPVFNPREALDTSPDGRWTIEMDTWRVAVREIATGRLAAWEPLAMVALARFLPNGRDIIIVRRSGVSLWVLERRGRGLGLRMVRPLPAPERADLTWGQLTASRSRLAVRTVAGSVFTLPLDGTEQRWTAMRPRAGSGQQWQFDVGDRWIIARGSGLDMSALPASDPGGAPVRLMAASGRASATSPSPDGRWLAAMTMDRELHIFRAGSWEAVHQAAQSGEKVFYLAPAPAWSRSGRWLAVARDMADIEIIEAGTWRVLVRLRSPLRSPVVLALVTSDERRLVVRRQNGSLEAWDIEALARDLESQGIHLDVPPPLGPAPGGSPPELDGPFEDPPLPPMVFPQERAAG